MPRTIPKERFHYLVEAATSVFLEEGYRRAQIAHVAARMGVAKGTVYLYVESKEALFHAVVRHADRLERVELPDVLPVPTPPPGATLEEVRKLRSAQPWRVDRHAGRSGVRRRRDGRVSASLRRRDP